MLDDEIKNLLIPANIWEGIFNNLYRWSNTFGLAVVEHLLKNYQCAWSYVLNTEGS